VGLLHLGERGEVAADGAFAGRGALVGFEPVHQVGQAGSGLPQLDQLGAVADELGLAPGAPVAALFTLLADGI